MNCSTKPKVTHFLIVFLVDSHLSLSLHFKIIVIQLTMQCVNYKKMPLQKKGMKLSFWKVKIPI